VSVLAKMVPSKSVVSSTFELAGLGAIVAGVFGMAGLWWGLIASGIAAVVYGAALDR